jgi:hypothetical protein
MSWTEPVDLNGAFVFLSASFPTPPRAEAYPPARPDEINDAVTAVARGILASGGRLVFGGHPTITPLVLLVAGEMAALGDMRGLTGEQPPVLVYQSRLYMHLITEETYALQDRGYGRIEWVDAAPGETPDNNDESMRGLRERMFGETRPLAGFFVGGMEGIPRERETAAVVLGAGFRAFPLPSAGGAAATLTPPLDIGEDIARLLGSRRYPAAVQAALTAIPREAELGDDSR